MLFSYLVRPEMPGIAEPAPHIAPYRIGYQYIRIVKASSHHLQHEILAEKPVAYYLDSAVITFHQGFVNNTGIIFVCGAAEVWVLNK